MALIITLSINTELKNTIEVCRVTNTDRVVLKPDDISEYTVTEYLPGGWIRHGPTITHRYGDSGAALAYEALKSLVDPE